MNFLYTVDPEAEEPIMLINRHVGFDSEDGYGIMGDLFQAELLALDGLGKKRIQVWINSVGGVVIDGYNIYNAILKSKTPVDTYCMGIAASIAGVIFQAGRKRIMSDYGILMYHNPYGSDDKTLEATRQSIVKMVASKSGKSEAIISDIMKRETFILADEAVAMGLCDEIESSEEYNKKHWKQMVNKSDSQGIWKAAATVMNKQLNPSINKMKKVTNRLKLNEDANEDSILSAIDGIENRATKAETELATAKTEFDALNKSKSDLEAEMKNHKDAYEKCKADLDKMKNDMDAAEDKAKEEKAKNMVEGFARIGKIKNDAGTLAKWTGLAKTDHDGTKKMLEDLPVNKLAPKDVTSTEPATEGAIRYSAAGRMAEIANRGKK